MPIVVVIFITKKICPAGTNKLQIYSIYNINQPVIFHLANFNPLSRHHILYRVMYNLHSRIPLFSRSSTIVRQLQLALGQDTVQSTMLALMLKVNLRLSYTVINVFN